MTTHRHVCRIRYSKDGGHNDGDGTEHDLGATGEFGKRVLRTRMGRSRQRVIEVEVTTPRRAALLAGSIKAELER